MKNKTYNILLIIIGALGLLLSYHYSGSFDIITRSFGANVTFAFGAYFILRLFSFPFNKKGIANAGLAFFLVSLQEVAQALSVYPGTFDPLDFAFNALGALVAMIVDIIIARSITKSE